MPKAFVFPKLNVFLFLSTLLLITCNLPIDPAKNPNVVDAKIFLLDSSLSIVQGKQATFGIIITYPIHVTGVTISFDQNRLNDTTVYCRTKTTEVETLIVKFTYHKDSTKTIKATIKLTNSNFKVFEEKFNVSPQKNIITFISKPKMHLAIINEPDTLLFVASNSTSGDGILFKKPFSEPPLDSTHLKLIVKKDTAQLIVIPVEKKVYTVYCSAQYGDASDSAKTDLIIYEKPIYRTSSAKETQNAGTTDTLFFIIPGNNDISLQYHLLDSNSYKPGVISILPKISDTLKIVFTPSEVKTYIFLLHVKKDSLCDTVSYQRIVAKKQQPIWKQMTEVITVTEGKMIFKTFAIYLIDSTLTNVTFTASKGIISGKVLNYSVPWGSIQKDSIIISANYKGTVSELKLLFNVLPGDNTAPKIQLISPESNNYKTKSDRITIKLSIVDTLSGIGSVLFFKGNILLTDTSHSDSVYQCIAGDLKNGKIDTVTVIAIDASMSKNKDSLALIITRDTTTGDNEAPAISILSEPKSGDRITNATGIIKVYIKDISGIANVSASHNGNPLTGITKSSDEYNIPFNLNSFGLNRFVINATDNSAKHNSDSLTITFDYNTKLTPLTLISPADKEQYVDTFPAFKWAGGNDNDGDTVFYQIRYGTSANAMVNIITSKGDIDSINLIDNLSINTKYYWQLFAYTTGTYKDTVKLPAEGVFSFTTINPDHSNPVINIISPSNYYPGVRVTEETSTISFTAIDANGIDSVYYTINGGVQTMITGTGSPYSFKCTLPKRGLDTIVISAVDGSAKHNRTSYAVIVNYNSQLTGIINLNSPANNSTEIPVLTQFSWAQITDADNDPVFYVVEYSTTQPFSMLNSQYSNEVVSDNVTITTENKLLNNTLYYYRVIAYTKAPYRDTVYSTKRQFSTENLKPEVSLSLPLNGAAQIDPANGTLQFHGTDPEGKNLTYSVAIGTSSDSVLSSQMRVNNLTAASINLSAFGTLSYAKQYFWRVIATDNGAVPKSDSSEIYSFYTVNRAPVWSPIPSKDSTFYRCNINLSQFCKDPDGNALTYSVAVPSNAIISGNIITCTSDSQLITIKAIDNFAAQPCSAEISFRRWFTNPQLMKFIPAKNQTFRMGGGNALPIHDVIFTYDFWMDSVEVTQPDFLTKMSFNPSSNQSATQSRILPVETITWYDAILYCNERSKTYGLDTIYTYSKKADTVVNSCTSLSNITINYTKDGFRLPTEAEWEYACRAKTSTMYYWGDDATIMSNYAYVCNSGLSTPVGKLLPNIFFLYDMLGNVQEFCNDFYYDPYPNTTQADPTGPQTGTEGKIVRGGIFRSENSGEHNYCAYRNQHSENGSWDQLGFRCVRRKF